MIQVIRFDTTTLLEKQPLQIVGILHIAQEGKIRNKVPADTGLLEVLGTPREMQRASVETAGTRGLAGIGRCVEVAPGVSSRSTRWNGATHTRAAHVAGQLHR